MLLLIHVTIYDPGLDTTRTMFYPIVETIYHKQCTLRCTTAIYGGDITDTNERVGTAALQLQVLEDCRLDSIRVH